MILDSIPKWMGLLLLLSALMTWSGATQASTRCYRVPRANSTEMSPIARPRSETWCYQSLDYPIGHTFIFNFDEGEIHPETALLLSPDGVITHASRVSGELTVHRLLSEDFNPLSIPLQEPQDLEALNDLDFQAPLAEAKHRQALELFLHTQVQTSEFKFLQVGTSAASVPDEHLPWRGYWWPYSGAPLYGSNQSPLAKYDRFVEVHSGTNPQSKEWEAKYHQFRGVSWAGHCNGWAASAILRPEPATTVLDSATGLNFSVSDQKGILAERDYCASAAFFGNRYYGRPGNNIYDISPDLFHKTITYYIAQLGKPVAFDYKRDEAVDNHIITAYSMRTVPINSRQYDVTTALSVRGYDPKPSNQPGVARLYKKTYHYVLNTDENGNISGGHWISENPDFLWVPLDSPDCESQNPNIKENWTQQILNLPRQ